MSIEDQLVDSSKQVIEIVARNIGDDPEKFRETLSLSLSEKPKISARALRVVYTVANQKNDFIYPYIKDLIKSLPSVKNNSVKSGILKIFAHLDLPLDDDDIGRLYGLSFECIQNSTDDMAGIKVYSLDVLYKITNRVVELKPELLSLIEEQITRNSYAFQARAIRIKNKLIKEMS